eukprot:9394444-Pyramimonas_sp.AAC.1
MGGRNEQCQTIGALLGVAKSFFSMVGTTAGRNLLVTPFFVFKRNFFTMATAPRSTRKNHAG